MLLPSISATGIGTRMRTHPENTITVDCIRYFPGSTLVVGETRTRIEYISALWCVVGVNSYSPFDIIYQVKLVAV